MVLHRSKPAFTMLEMLVVVSLIGFLFAFIAPRIANYMRKAGSTEIKFKLAGVKEALQQYRMQFGAYPTEREGLRALVENPRPNDETYKRHFARENFIQADQLADKQGNEFVYHIPPQRFKNKFKQFEILYLGSSGDENDPEAQEDGI